MKEEFNRLFKFLDIVEFMLEYSFYMAVIAIVAFCCGCTTTPEGNVQITIPAATVDFATNAVREYMESRTSADSATGGSVSEGGASSGVAEPASSSIDLDFKYGGFNGRKAVEVAGCQIKSLKVTSDKLTYKWASGGCEALGATSKTDYDHTLACVFFWNGSKWIGGKFDWVSTSRTSRSLENVRGGYGGWDGASFFAAKKHGFCIVSSDGKKRSNFIED